MAWRIPFVMAATLAVLAAGCGGGNRHAAPATTTTASSGPCKLNARQRRAVRLALRDIRRLRQIQAPLTRFSDQGTPAQESVTGKFLLDMGRGKLPVNMRGHLIDLAKSAVGLCGQCFQGLEAEEPAVSGGRFGRGTRCGG